MNRPLFYRVNDLCSEPGRDGLLPISASTFWRQVRAGKFPPPVKIGPNITAWRASDVMAWADSLETVIPAEIDAECAEGRE